MWSNDWLVLKNTSVSIELKSQYSKFDYKEYSSSCPTSRQITEYRQRNDLTNNLMIYD